MQKHSKSDVPNTECDLQRDALAAAAANCGLPEDAMRAAMEDRNDIRKMYEAAVKEANLVVWEFDIINHRIIMAENEFTEYDYRKFGLPKITENAPQALIPYIDDAYVSTFLNMYEKIEAGEPSASCEVWYKLRPGTEPRCERISHTTVYDASGRAVKAYGIGQNITRQKLAQADYDRLRAQLTGNLTDVVCIFQLNLSKNRYISGYSPYPGITESLMQATADDHFAAAAAAIIDEDVRQSIQKEFVCSNLVKLFKEGKHEIEHTYSLRISSGQIMWIRCTLHMMQNPYTGDLEGITYSKDITEEKRTHEIINTISKISCDYIAIIDTTDNSFEVNTLNWNCEIIPPGKKTDYTKGRKLFSDAIITPDTRADYMKLTNIDILIKELHVKTQYIVLYDCINESNANAPYKKQMLFSWLNEEQKDILCIQQDVTEAYQKEQKQIEDLKKAKLDADTANEAKSSFLSSMSHDLRTPLNGVLGFTALALKETDPQKRQEYLGKIETSGKLLLDLINDTLELSRIESGKAKLEMEAVMPNDLIPAVTTALKPSADLKGIHYKTAISVDLNTPIWCDKLKVQKIALNLISNAIKYTHEGGSIRIGLSLESSADLDESYILSVEDTGIGMSKQFIKNMYEPFAQEKRSESIKEAGTGLGLSIVKRYVDLMGGHIEVESELHKGTRIKVRLPISRQNKSIVQMKTDTAKCQSLEGKHILLCEDNSMNTEIAVMLLKDRGMSVETAGNGKEGVEQFLSSKEGSFDAVLMDIRMPVMDGYEAVKRIRALPRPDAKTVPIIAMSADAFEESVRESRAVGMNDYVTKPIEPKMLYDVIERCIYKKL